MTVFIRKVQTKYPALTVLLLGLVLSGCTSTDGRDGAPALSSVAEKGTENDVDDGADANTKTIAAQAGISGGEVKAATQLAGLQSAPLPLSRVSRAAAIPSMAYASADNLSVSPATIAAFKTPANAPDGLDELIQKYAATYQVPERLVRRVVHRESRFNPAARNGPYWGLMQISHPTARGMGYRGQPSGLLDAETNLKYAVKYLAGAYKVAEGDENQAVKFYARGYYYDAKRKGLLEETGLRPVR